MLVMKFRSMFVLWATFGSVTSTALPLEARNGGSCDVPACSGAIHSHYGPVCAELSSELIPRYRAHAWHLVQALENLQTKLHGSLNGLSACMHCKAAWGEVMTRSFPDIDYAVAKILVYRNRKLAEQLDDMMDECGELGQSYADFATKASAKVKEELIKAGHGLIKFYSDVNLPQLVQIIMDHDFWGKKGLCRMDTIPEEADDKLGRCSQL